MGKFILICFVCTLVIFFALMGIIYLVRDIVRDARNEVIIAYPKEKNDEHTDKYGDADKLL